MRTALLIAVAQQCEKLERIRNVSDLIAECEGPAPYMILPCSAEIVYWPKPGELPKIGAAYGRDGWRRERHYSGGFSFVKTMPNGAKVRIEHAEVITADGSEVDPTVFGPEASLPPHHETTNDQAEVALAAKAAGAIGEKDTELRSLNFPVWPAGSTE